MEEGLGPHRGYILQFPNGLVASLKESLWKPELGVHVEVDGVFLREMGIEKIVSTILSGLELPVDRLVWKSPLLLSR